MSVENGLGRNIIFSHSAEVQFDPLDYETMALEMRLLAQEIAPGGRIAGAKPMIDNKLPKNTAKFIFHGKAVLIAPEQGNFYVMGAATEGKELDKLVRKLT